MPYFKTIWKNKQTPAINDTNLNKIEQGLADALVILEEHVSNSDNPHATTKEQLNADSAATAADRLQTGLDRIAVSDDRIAVEALAVQVSSDALQTGADRVQTGLDRTAVGGVLTAVQDIEVLVEADRVAVADDLATVSVLKGNVDDVLYQVTEDRVVTLAARNLAQKWANEAEDQEVTAGKFSAYHWAQKAEISGGGVIGHEGRYDHIGYDNHLADTGNPHGTTYQQVGAQAPLVSGVNIKTVSGKSLLGSENIEAEVETGFSTPQTVVVAYDPVARTITLSGVGTLYHNGNTILDVSLGHVSAPHADTAGGWFYYHDGTDFVWSMTPWSFGPHAMIAYCLYGANSFAIRECHGLMDWESHREFHEQIGTYRRSGGDVTVVTGSAVTADKQPTVSTTTLADEDLPSVLPALSVKGSYTHFYLFGPEVVTFSTGNAHITLVDGNGRLQINEDVAGAIWDFTSINVVNNFHNVWMIGLPVTSDSGSQDYRYVFFQGQEIHTSLAAARDATFEGLNIGNFALLAPEWVVLEKFILRSSNLNNGWTVEENQKVISSRTQALVASAGISTHTLLSDRDLADQHPIAAITGLQSALDGKEPVFTKNTAFNKNFGVLAGTVCEGNDSRLSDARTPVSHDNTHHSVAFTPQTRQLTINGVAQDLAADRSYNVGTVTSVDLTAGAGISVSGGPVTGSGNITVTNAAPHQATNLAQGTRNSTQVPVTSSTGTGATLDSATTTLAGVMSAADKLRLDNMDDNANNYTHPTYLGDDIDVDSGPLTGATVISDIDFNVTTDTLGHVTDANGVIATRTLTAADIGAAATSHTHSIANVTNLQTQLNYARGLNEGSSASDPNTTISNVILSNHANSPSTSFYWHITTTFYSTISTTGNRGQIAVQYNSGNAVYARSCFSNVWTAWVRCDNGPFSTTSDVRFDSFGVGTAASGVTGEIRATNNVTAYYSDRRLKENISSIDDALKKVKSINGVTFRSNDLAAMFGYTDRSEQVGVIAQEIEKVLPQAVTAAPFDTFYDDEGKQHSRSGENYKTVRYEKIVPLLIQAIKELSKEVEELKEVIYGA